MRSIIPSRTRWIIKGFALACIASFFAYGLSIFFGAPLMLSALLIGMAINPFISTQMAFQAGIDFSASTLLKFGIVLLGARISFEMILTLGWKTLVIILAVVALSLSLGMLTGRLMKKSAQLSILTATAVSICGSSAALAIACVLPATKNKDKDLSFTIMSVTILSSLGMIIYPMVTHLPNFTDEMAGIVMGLSLHNVAQSVASGFLISDTAGDTATIVKMARISLLAPYLLFFSIFLSRQCKNHPNHEKPPLVPLFLLGFIAVVGLNSMNLIPPMVQEYMKLGSKLLLCISVAAIGLQTSLINMKKMGFQAFNLVIFQSLIILALSIIAVFSLS